MGTRNEGRDWWGEAFMATLLRACAHDRPLPNSILLHRLIVVLALAVIAGCGLPGDALPTGVLPTVTEGQTETWPQAHLYPKTNYLH